MRSPIVGTGANLGDAPAGDTAIAIASGPHDIFAI